MQRLPDPTQHEIQTSLAAAATSTDPTVRELVRVLWLVTTATGRPDYWSGLPSFDGG